MKTTDKSRLWFASLTQMPSAFCKLSFLLSLFYDSFIYLKNRSQDDISKRDASCLIFGIGLVLLDNSNVNEPQFEIRARPLYVNKYMKLIEKELFG